MSEKYDPWEELFGDKKDGSQPAEEKKEPVNVENELDIIFKSRNKSFEDIYKEHSAPIEENADLDSTSVFTPPDRAGKKPQPDLDEKTSVLPGPDQFPDKMPKQSQFPDKLAKQEQSAPVDYEYGDFASAGDQDWYDEESEIRGEATDKPIRRSRRRRSGLVGGLMYFAFVVGCSLLLACFGWLAARDVLALGKDYMEAEVSIPEDADLDTVANILKESGLIEYKFLFKMFANLSHAMDDIDPGTYTLDTSLDYNALVLNMQLGSSAQAVVEVMIPEGYTAEETFAVLEENGVCSAEDLMDVALNGELDYDFLDNSKLGDISRVEGYLFPDTYEFYVGDDPQNVIEKFLDNFENRVTEEMYTQAADMGYTMDQIITIASLIEEEAANNDERATIASVIYNRLNADMLLQIDATIQYILPERKPNLSLDDLAIDSPYNTYLYTGLPVGAISNPGLASIQAALDPENTGYYYYALDTETGTHRFFTNSADHEAFVATQNYG